jgi:hypothetical protein
VHVGGNREVEVHERRLRDVADPRAQRRRPGRQAEHLDGAASDALHAHDRADERRLARAARAQQTGHETTLDREIEAFEHAPPAPIHTQSGNPDSRLERCA